jgi:hypothetical protein
MIFLSILKLEEFFFIDDKTNFSHFSTNVNMNFRSTLSLTLSLQLVSVQKRGMQLALERGQLYNAQSKWQTKLGKKIVKKFSILIIANQMRKKKFKLFKI